MNRHVYSRQTDKLIRVEDAEPECGKDFCDRCGDCLDCYGGDPCWDGSESAGDHFWVTYEDEKGADNGNDGDETTPGVLGDAD